MVKGPTLILQGFCKLSQPRHFCGFILVISKLQVGLQAFEGEHPLWGSIGVYALLAVQFFLVS